MPKLLITPNSEISFKVNISGSSNKPTCVEVRLTQNSDRGLVFLAHELNDGIYSALLNFSENDLDLKKSANLNINVIIKNRFFTPFSKEVSFGDEEVTIELQTNTKFKLDNIPAEYSEQKLIPTKIDNNSILISIAKEDVELKKSKISKNAKNIFEGIIVEKPKKNIDKK